MNISNSLGKNFALIAMLISCSFFGQTTTSDKLSRNNSTLDRPNIVLLFIDDYGWSDIGFRNNSFITPNLDQFKKESLEFTRAYIPTPTCSPSRLSLLTGKEAVRVQMTRHIPEPEYFISPEFNLWPKDPAKRPSRNYLPLEEVTYAEKLRDLGYYNMFIGKWHLGHKGKYPMDQGFHAEYGTTDHGHPQNYYYPFFKLGDPNHFMKNFEKGDYLTDVLTDGAVDFIRTYDKQQPFMLSFWFYSVHGPSIGRIDLLDKQQPDENDKYDHHRAMVKAMDESVGRVIKALKDKGIADSTVIIILSDQGGAYSNAPLKGGKMGGNTLGEGGSRVPFFINYPGLTKPNSECHTPVQSIDIFPTLIEIASGRSTYPTNIQGLSLMPILYGGDIKDRNLYFFRSYEDQYTAVISGDWKLIKYHSGKFELFDVVNDISEERNMINKGLDIEDQLKKDLLDWEDEAVPSY